MFEGYFMPKLFLYKNRSNTIKPKTGGGKVTYAFSKVISPKVTIIVRLEFEVDDYDVAVQHVYYYATGILHYK